MHSFGSITATGLVAVGILAASGCAGIKYGSAEAEVAPDSVVRVNRQLEIPAGEARVYFQYGAEIGKREIDEGTTHCSLLMQVRHKKGSPRLSVAPERFEIARLSAFSDLENSFATLAVSTSRLFDPPVRTINTVTLRLQSNQQPDVRALICAKHSNRTGRHYPTRAEIGAALGDAITIEAP